MTKTGTSGLDDARMLRAFVAATMPDAQSKAAYIGRISQTETVTIIADDGTSFEKEVVFPINWDSISKILDLIGKRVAG